jgi:hypothetical protein
MATDTEIMGGIGYGEDEYQSQYHTDTTLYSNGPRNHDPYLPILNENMGRDWAPSEFLGSFVPRGRGTDEMRNNYPYRDIYTMSDPLRRNDYYLRQLPNAPEHLMTNFPTFHSRDPMTAAPSPTPSVFNIPFVMSNDILIVILLIFVIVLAFFQSLQNLYLMSMLSSRVAAVQ